MRAVFFDRDGVINQSPGPGKYVMSPEEFIFQSGAKSTLAAIKAAGWRTVLITNQQCVGKTLLSESGLLAIHAVMQAELGEEAAFDQIEFCPHLKGTCECRKPSPFMVNKSAKDLGINVRQSWFVGDNDTDILCGKAASVKTLIRFLSEKEPKVPADHTVANFAELKALFEKELLVKPD
jgi:D-glycero-D-manno-heptose 1,7-bisphosphate phosphatase